MRGPDQLIHPFACRNCGEPLPHGWRYSENVGMHQWTQPTPKQIKYRMIRRRKNHGAERWR